jgi:hypothetical protein
MISLVTKSHNAAKDKGARRVQAAHLKQAVIRDEQFDFLADIIAKVPDSNMKDDEAAGEEGTKKRKRPAGEGRGRGRAKKESDEE